MRAANALARPASVGPPRRRLARVAERGVTVTLSDDARTLLGNLGYDPAYGARPLRRVIQKQLTDRLALALLEGELQAGGTVRVDALDGRLLFHTPQGPHTHTVRGPLGVG